MSYLAHWRKHDPLKKAETAERYGVKTLVSNISWNIFKFTIKANGPMNIPCFNSVIHFNLLPQILKCQVHPFIKCFGIHDFQHVLLLVIIFNGKTIL